MSRDMAFRFLADNSEDIIVCYDLDGRRRYVNPAWQALAGLDPVEVLGKTDGQPPALSVPDFFGTRFGLTARGEADELEVEIDSPSQGSRVFNVRYVQEMDAEGKQTGVLAVGRDITLCKRMEAELASRAKEFRTLAENLPDVLVRFDRTGRFVYANPKFEAVFGVRLADLVGKWPAQVTGLLEAGFFERQVLEAAHSRQGRKIEQKVRAANGHAVCGQVHIVPEFDDAGEVGFVLLVMRDISERRQLEERLRMADSVFDSAREGIIITDLDGKILDVNPAFSRISGYERDEVLGRNPSLLSSGRQDKSFYSRMWSSLLNDGAWSGEVDNRRKDGEIYTEHLDIVALRSERGDTLRYIGVFSDVSLLKSLELRLRHIAHYDALTGLPNRLLLTDRMLQAMSQSDRTGEVLAVLYLDLDGFKPINDRHGNDVGDFMLCEIARRISATLRPHDSVARIGGDEFVVLLTGQTSSHECETAARRLLQTIEQPIQHNGDQLILSASIGISLYSGEDDEPDSLLRYADQAMYTAKRLGRNQFVVYDQDAREKNRLNGQMVHDLREALELGQISVHYQPIVDMATGLPVKAEALVRWRHPRLGMMSPSEFIPIAEDSGLIHAVGDLAFIQADRVAKKWNRQSRPDFDGQYRISVNCSPRQFFNRDGVSIWAGYLVDKKMAGLGLGVEITEGVLLDDRPDVLKQLDQLRAMGMTVSLDDFGTGYSSLSYLKKFPIDYLKIDRSFIRDIVADPSDRAIVESIIVMARRLGIKLIAEGVETREQADLLLAAGCDLAQGFYFAKPMPESDFLAYVGRSSYLEDAGRG
jgi:diguanylate cyclase (GGDEF)-like protein/PAS domain S-box-containing protein